MKGINFDDILEDIGPMGRYQIMHVVLLGLALLIVGCNHLGSVFIAGLPVYHCTSGINHVDQNYTTPALYSNESIVDTLNTNSERDECTFTNGNKTESCTEWSYETDVFKSTIASEVSSLICELCYV